MQWVARVSLRLAACLAVVFFSVRAPAQQAWIVDTRGGGHFTDFGPALDAAASGDSIVIRGGGTFPNLYIVFQKALHISSEGGRPQFTRGINFAYVPAGAGGPIVITGLDLGGSYLQECRAMFIAEDCTIGNFTTLSSAGATLQRCAFGMLARIPNTYPLSISTTPTVLTSCMAQGGVAICNTSRPPFSSPQPGVVALFAQRSAVEIADTTLLGGDGTVLSCGIGQAAASIYLLRSELRATRSSLIGGSLNGIVGLGATLDQSALTLDPSVVLMGSVANTASTVASANIPAALGLSAPPGGTLSYRLEGVALSASALFASFDATPPLTIDLGLLWLNSSALLLAHGTTDATGRIGGTLAVPLLTPSGALLVLQGFQASSTAPGLLLSTPLILQAL